MMWLIDWYNDISRKIFIWMQTGKYPKGLDAGLYRPLYGRGRQSSPVSSESEAEEVAVAGEIEKKKERYEKVQVAVESDEGKNEGKISEDVAKEGTYLLKLGMLRMQKITLTRTDARAEWAWQGIKNQEKLLRKKVNRGVKRVGKFARGYVLRKWFRTEEEMEQWEKQQTAAIDKLSRDVWIEVAEDKADLVRWIRILNIFEAQIKLIMGYIDCLIHEQKKVKEKVEVIEAERDIEIDKLRIEEIGKDMGALLAEQRFKKLRRAS